MPLCFKLVIRSAERLTAEDHADRHQLGVDQNLLSLGLSTSTSMGVAGLTFTMRVRGLMAVLPSERMIVNRCPARPNHVFLESPDPDPSILSWAYVSDPFSSGWQLPFLQEWSLTVAGQGEDFWLQDLKLLTQEAERGCVEKPDHEVR